MLQTECRTTALSARLPLFVLGVGLLATLVCQTSVEAADDDEEDVLLSGVPARYEAQLAGRAISFERRDSVPTFLLARDQSPDPRLPASGWKVAWKGALLVKSPGRYQFAGRASGLLVMRVGGKEVLSLKGQTGRIAEEEGPGVELKFGNQLLEVEFTPQGEGAELTLFWQSEDFPREPLPSWAIGHLPSKHDSDADSFRLGRLLVEEHSCVACHRPAALAPFSSALGTRPGPHLTDAGARLKREWIYHWLGNPQDFRPEAVMPRMFGSDRRGEVERYAVASFLALRGSRPVARRLDENQQKNWPAEGKTLFESVGCTVCHEAHDDAGKTRPARATLRKLGQKTSVEALATFIHNPATSDPAGRMPALAFANGDDPFRLALYLTSRDVAESQPLALPTAPEPAEIREALAALALPAADIDLLARKPPIDQLMTLARQAMRARRCTSCHEMRVSGEDEFWKPLPAARDFAAIGGGTEGGCLDLQRNPGSAGIPVFGSSLEAGAGVNGGVGHVRDFLKAAAVAPGTAAPGETARLILARFNCTGCHDRHGAGGLPSGLVAKMLVNQSEQNAESVSPPPLTGIAGKLLGPAIRQALDGSLRSRLWMSLQMPRFDTAQLAPLPAALAAADGQPLREEAFRPPADEAVIAAGRTLVGEKGFSCTKCHDMLGIPSLGTRGPELARVAERVNYDWYLRWMTDPQRLQPGTRMPTVFFGGKSAYTHILDGVPDKQRLAIWQYLLVCRNLPYPEGLRPPQKLRFPDSSTVQMVRTFLPETSARGIALRSPDQLHLAFDAQNCRLSYAWSGEFLDMRPVWDGRGGNQAGIDGTRFWTAPAGFPWDVTPSAGPVPDFSNRGNDTSLGAIAPQDGKLYPTRLDFRSVQTKPDRTVFNYELDVGGEQKATFTETVSTFRQELAIGVRRRVDVNFPAGQFLWLNVSNADQPPTWSSGPNQSGALDAEAKSAPSAAAISLVQGGRRYVFHLRGKTLGADWLAVRRADHWSLVLRVPAPGGSSRAALDLVLLKPLDDEPATQAKVASEEFGK